MEVAVKVAQEVEIKDNIVDDNRIDVETNAKFMIGINNWVNVKIGINYDVDNVAQIDTETKIKNKVVVEEMDGKVMA